MKRFSAAFGSGILFAVLYNLIGSFLDVYLGYLFHEQEHPIVVLVFTFSIMALFFLALQIPRWREFTALFRTNFRTIVWINVTTAMAWLGSFLALKYLEPAIFTAICFGFGPIINVVFWKWLRPERPPYPSEITSAAGMLLALVALSATSVSGYSGLGKLSGFQVFAGLSFALLAAAGVVLVVVSMKGLSEKGVDSKTMMALRFLLVIVMGLALWPAGPVTPSPFFKVFLPTMALFSIIALIIPLYLGQLAIQRVEPITFSILGCLTPAFTFLLQFFDSRLTPSIPTLVGVMLCMAFALQGVFAARRKENRERIERYELVKPTV